MNDGKGTLDTCLAEAQWLGGDDSDTLWCSLNNRTQKGSPCSAYVGVKPPRVYGSGNFQDEATDMKCGWSQAGLLLHWGSKVSLGPKEPIRRSSAPAALIQAMGLCDAPAAAAATIPAEEQFAREALRWNWAKRWPGAPNSHRGSHRKGEPWLSGRPSMCKAGGFKGEPRSAFSSGLGLPVTLSQLSARPPAQPEGLPEGETRCASSVSKVNNWVQENSSKWQKYIKWSADSIGDIDTAVFKLANPLCHS